MDKKGDVIYSNVILFDGVCNLCNASVDFILKRDADSDLKFASLQSDFAQRIIKSASVEVLPDSFLFYSNGQLYKQSDAVCQVAKHLQLPWNLAFGLRFVPKILRDRMYAWVAKNRYKWFGKKETCRVPTLEERSRFLD